MLEFTLISLYRTFFAPVNLQRGYFGVYAEEYVNCPLLLPDFDQNHSRPICNTFNQNIEIHEKSLQLF